MPKEHYICFCYTAKNSFGILAFHICVILIAKRYFRLKPSQWQDTEIQGSFDAEHQVCRGGQ
jgi:hypothetical protein